MRAEAVTKSYRRWAPIYDLVFGKAFEPGRRRATAFANAKGGRVLEVGVGTGLSLALYRDDLSVTGIDFSAEMLAKAATRATALQRDTIALQQMDAQQMAFASESFDVVIALHVLSVVPDPVQTLAEMVRVCRPGGHIVIVNHFAAEAGLMKVLERGMQGWQHHLGWQSDFPIETVLSNADLSLVERRVMPPFGVMTWLLLQRC